MKLLMKVTLISILFLTLANVASAQDEHKCPMHKHGWNFSDSAHMKDFSCAMEDFDLNEFPFSKHKSKHKYNGHWAGVELGISGYLTSDLDMSYGKASPWLNMNNARSMTVNLNPFELNVNLYKDHIGFTTGLGFQISNYYFTNNYVMLKDSSSLVAYKVQDAQGNYIDMKVNKMVVSYLNLPLFFEYQTNRHRKLSSFHVSLGAIAGLRIGTYTKQVYSNEKGSYFLVDDTGNRVAAFDVEHNTVRDRGTYHLNPFKVDAAVRIGWSHLNLFGTYSLTRMFQKDQGPELYPFTVGITLLGF